MNFLTILRNIFIIMIIASFLMFSYNFVLANSVTELLDQAGEAAQYDTAQTSLPTLVGKIIKAFLSLLGVFFIGLTIYGGFLWMNARGDAEQAKKAQDILKDAVIGLVIVIAAYAVTYFVLYYIAKDYMRGGGGF